MPTQRYRTLNGKVVPGVTTLLGIVGDKGGMIYTANRLALEPALQGRALIEKALETGVLNDELKAYLQQDPADWDHKLFWGKKADAGTAAHEMFDCYNANRPFEPKPDQYSPEALEIAKPAFEAAVNWAEQAKFKVVEREVSLVSEKYRFGGTRDGVFVGDKRSIADVKTSRAVYSEYLLQLAAYGILDEEAGNVVDGGYHILHFSKQEKPGDPVHWSHHFWSHLDAQREAFLLVRRLYDLLAETAKLAK